MVAAVFDRDVVRVSGPDAEEYLQGQVSQDITALGVGDSAWSLLLDPSGKLISWFRAHRLADDEFILDTEAGSGADMLARLQRFVLRTDVAFEALSGWRMLSVRADDPPPVDGLAAEVHWPGFEGVDVLGADLDVPATTELDAAAFEEARIAAGVPKLGVDLDHETIPAEGGAALIEGAVSFTKGCYTGQELVARIDSRGGNVPRPLRRLRGEGAFTVGAFVAVDGADVGTVTSSAPGVALARVMRKVEPGTNVVVGETVATVEVMP